MHALSRVRRSFRDLNYAQGLRRAWDERPLQCSLYVTERCNLDCRYCTEYDNSVPHPSLETLERWVRKIRDLGTQRIALVGGEPLSHPGIVELTRYCRELGFSTSLTTNGFLLSRELVRALEEAGLGVMQVSIDRMTPSPVTRKAMKTLAGKLDLVAESRIKLHLTGVLCADTLDESEAVLTAGLARGVPSEIRLLHAGPDSVYRVERGQDGRLQEILRSMIARKQAGEKIHTTRAILEYQRALLDGREPEWTCTGGFKLFFVSAKGQFMECSMKPTPYHIEEMTPERMRSFHGKKECQRGCGVYCVVAASLFYEHPLRYLAGEVVPRVRQLWSELRRVAAPAARRVDG
jgi:MoaA/NifB/PqqE/SkfB family radical SAM enzyme